jgi:hypothetical protein
MQLSQGQGSTGRTYNDKGPPAYRRAPLFLDQFGPTVTALAVQNGGGVRRSDLFVTKAKIQPKRLKPLFPVYKPS